MDLNAKTAKTPKPTQRGFQKTMQVQTALRMLPKSLAPITSRHRGHLDEALSGVGVRVEIAEE
jgi:hypothetical protein